VLRDRRKEITEAAGLVAIIASLLFLAFEIQQSNRIAIASTEIGIRNGYSEFNRGIYSSAGITDLLSMAKDPGVEWTSVEELTVMMIASDLLNVWLSVETACDHGLAQASTCAELGNDIRGFIIMFPGTRQLWRFFLDNYPGLASTEIFSTISQALEE
jgi:hypothetical protein